MTAAVPDPRFRDQLAGAATAVGDMAEDWWCPKREGVRRTECRYCIAEFAVDALMPTIAAEVEARVQAAAAPLLAKLRAVEAVLDEAEQVMEPGGIALVVTARVRRALDVS